MKEVSIIIPAYNAHNTIEATLCSIAYQMFDKDLYDVTIVNDCSDYDYSNEVEFFSKLINIKEIKNDKNYGPGLTRQHGIDESNSKYIVFMDSDDAFCNCHSLFKLYNAIKENDYDIVVSDFLEQKKDCFLTIFNSHIWLHGKIFKREFLNRNHIVFNNSSHNEDNSFNQLVFLHNPKLFYLNESTYVWKLNENSITRKDNCSFNYNGLFGYVDNINWALDIALNDNCNKNEISSLALSSLTFLYYTYLEYYKRTDINKLLQKIKHTKDVYYSNPLSQNEEFNIISNQFNYNVNDHNRRYVLRACVTFDEFMKLLDNIKE